ncbi:MAG: PorT family protein [Flaviaesturariibacter sp.]|nr:PorT family protein [Flaviaesturariibacter sp.]
MRSSCSTVTKPGAIALIFSILSLSSFSQTTRLNLLVNGVTTNLNYGKANSTLEPYKKNITGLQLGASLQAGITPRFSLVTETYFIMKGGALKRDNPITGNKSTLRLYTAEIPVLARFQLGRVYINSGLYVAYTLAGRVKTAGTQAIPEKSTKLLFKNSPDGFKRLETGVQAGAGYLFDVKQTRFALDVRYGYGLTNISREIERYNRSLSLSLLVFNPWKKNPLGKKPDL